MAPKIGENTKITLDLKTIGTIAVMIATVVGMWYAVQADIQEAKELPKPDVTRTEYDLKDKLIEFGFKGYITIDLLVDKDKGYRF